MRGGNNFIDLTGRKINMLTVIERAENSDTGRTMWLCRCDCGNEKIIASGLLTKGISYSCGCKRRKNPIADITGFENEYLKVIGISEDYENSESRPLLWKCVCKSCGKEFISNKSKIKSEQIKGCGCTHYKKVSQSLTKHGKSNTRIFSIWSGMKNRCYNKNEPAYPRYGGRGIKICKEWKDNFDVFYKWAMDNGYKDNLSIDRIDNDGDYSPDNCRWATPTDQVRNRRNTLKFELHGKTKTLMEWCEEYNMSYRKVYHRIFQYGYDLESALNKK